MLCGGGRGFLRLFRLFLGGGSGGRFFLGFRFGFLLRVRLRFGYLVRFSLRLRGGGLGDLLLLFGLGCGGFRRFLLLGGLFLLLRRLLLLLSLRFGVLRGFLLRRQTLFLQLFQALLLLRLLLLKLFGLLLRLFLALLFGTLRIVALLLLAIVLLHHRAGIDHHRAHHGAITATAGAHVDIFLQRSPNQQGNQYEVQNDRNNNGAVQLIVLLSCLYQNRFPKTGVAYTGFWAAAQEPGYRSPYGQIGWVISPTEATPA